jgi:asparagine synthase (glutamine-hydrolysing)
MTAASSLSLGNPAFADAAPGGAVEPSARWAAAVAAGRAGELAAAARGAFAAGISATDGRGFAAVDRFAIHPLCYRVVDGRLRFAPRADDLADGGTPIDLQSIYDYLYFHVIPSPRTIYLGVQRLPAGHCATLEAGALNVRRYWRPRFGEPRRSDFAALSAEFRRLLQTAVARELDGGKPGCFLSGGTDSSTVAGMIGLSGGRPAATYSIGFEAAGYDEMEYARLAARHFGTEHHEYYVTPADLVARMADVAASYDQPFGNSSVLPAYYCARMAHDDGVKRLLAGDGGDELFGGNARYAKQRLFGYYDRVPEGLRKRVLEPIADRGAARRVPWRKLASYVSQARVPMPDRLQMYNLLRRVGEGEVLTPTFGAAVDRDAPLRLQREVWRQSADAGLVNRMLEFDWRFTLAESDLPKVCGAAALAGVQVGFPMLDSALVDFSLALPESYKLKGLKLRWFFKEALRGFLPDETITKKKQGFGLPFGVWAAQHEGLNRLARETLRGFAGRGVVRSAFIERLLSSLLPAHPGYFGELVWILCMLELWLQRHAPNWRL